MTESLAIKEFAFFSIFLITFLQFGFFVIIFTRKVMIRIERDIKKDGGVRPAQWDGTGARITFYALAVLMSVEYAKKADNPLFKYSHVRQYAKFGDRRLAIWLHVSIAVFMVVGFLGDIFGFY